MWHHTLSFFMSWFPHQPALLLSVPSTCFWSLRDLFHLSSTVLVSDYLIMFYSIKCLCTINEAQIYLFLYFQSLFNHSSRVDCIFPAQCSSAISGLILFPSCIMMILKSILIISLRKLFIICYSHSVIPGFFWQCYKYGFGNVWWNLTCVIDFAE